MEINVPKQTNNISLCDVWTRRPGARPKDRKEQKQSGKDALLGYETNLITLGKNS